MSFGVSVMFYSLVALLLSTFSYRYFPIVRGQTVSFPQIAVMLPQQLVKKAAKNPSFTVRATII